MSERRPRIAVLAGYWSTNIGNAFFQLGAQWVLQQAMPSAHVFLIGDQPGYWNVGKGNPANALDYAAHLDVDAIVIQGPFCRPEMRGIVGNLIQKQHDRGAKIIILAAGMMAYDDQTVKLSRDILGDAPPFILTTRDTETYELLGDVAEHAYDGIDVATFVTDFFPPIPTDLPPYVVLNFDQIPEPRIAPKSQLPPATGDTVFEWDGVEWTVRQPRMRTELAYRSRAWPFGESLIYRPNRPDKLGEHTIVRTDHRYNPFLPRKTYAAPRTYVGDIPHSYLNIYANSRCTISNRVHACVATASYGNPAMLFTRSPRAYLLKRLGLTTIKEKPTSIDLDFLNREKRAMIDWLTERLATMA